MKINNSVTSENSVRGNQMVFDEYARYYDLLYQDKDYQAEADYVAGLIRRFHSEARNILELGSGTGIHASLLAKQGFELHGVERSPEMLARALSLLEKVSDSEQGRMAFSQGDIRNIRLNKRFDIAISLFHVISYQITNEDVIGALQTARYHLNPGGLFIFDVWYGPAVLTDRPTVRIKRVADGGIDITRLAEPIVYPNENRVDVNYHFFIREKATNVVKELHEAHGMRYYFKPEIELLAGQTGFVVRHAEEWLSGSPVGWQTWGACFCLQTEEFPIPKN
jgi:SAM-dependent methyltransferase